MPFCGSRAEQFPATQLCDPVNFEMAKYLVRDQRARPSKSFHQTPYRVGLRACRPQSTEEAISIARGRGRIQSKLVGFITLLIVEGTPQ
jgi:hypothetical protein